MKQVKTKSTASPKSSSSVATTVAAAEKPTIFDIITETEKNQTLMQQAANRQLPSNDASSPAPVPVAMALSAQPPVQNHIADSPKAINHHVEIHHNGHAGVAEPLTWQQLETEMSMVEQGLKESSSTSKDGISTWILLSGSDKQQVSVTPATTTTVSHVDKLNVKDSDRHNYRLEQIHTEKGPKPIKDIVKRPKPEKKTKIPLVPSTTPPMPSSTLAGILTASDFTSDKNRRKNPLLTGTKLKNRKPSSTTTTTTTTTQAPEQATEILEAEHSIDKIDNYDESTTPVAFIVLEPKDADFDLPQDRSPATKKPSKLTTNKKRKPAKKNKVQKQPNKNVEKPISSTIYNYLSREVMPTVGVGLMGLVAAAGLASYFLGPFGALRRSYDVALDRQDTADSIYSVNSEEYASGDSDSGQNEEEIFGKFLAGMPANSRYVKYFRPDPMQNHQNHVQGGPGPYNNPNFRRVYPQQQQQPQPQAQATNVVPKYSPYMRYRTAPSPHYNTAQYNPQPAHPAYRNHHMNQAVPAVQQQVSPVYNPQYHEMQKQKSFANNLDTILKQQTIIYGTKQDTGYANTNSNVIQEKSIGAEIRAEPEDQQQQQTQQVDEQQQQNTNDFGDDMQEDEISAKIQRRTHFVVGSSITDEQPAEVAVSASMTASDGLESNDPKADQPVESVITVTAASHGPRRRRRRDTKDSIEQTTKAAPMKPDEGKKETSPSKSTTTTLAPASITPPRLYSKSELQNLESEYNLLNEKIMSFDRDYTTTETQQKVEKKIQTEFKSITADYDALKKAVDGAQAIEKFQKQIRIRAKNFELSVVLKTGISMIRQRIKYLGDLVEHPEDDRIIEKINRRDGSNASIDTETSTKQSTGTTNSFPEEENGFVGFLKLLQLKAQFGLHLLRNIRPSFERAFEDVFKRPYEHKAE